VAKLLMNVSIFNICEVIEVLIGIALKMEKKNLAILSRQNSYYIADVAIETF
jgi:hypothetical protein